MNPHDLVPVSTKVQELSVSMRPGMFLNGVAEEKARHIRRAVQLVQRELPRDGIAEPFLHIFGSRWQSTPIYGDAPNRAAWALVKTRVVGRLLGSLSGASSMRDAESWFFGKLGSKIGSIAIHLSEESDSLACLELERVQYDEKFAALLPYILEIHGPGSRASVMRDPSTKTARAAKRLKGVYYTPPDVAEYMTRVALNENGMLSGMEGRCLDPACGTGVFLRAVLDVRGNSTQNMLEFALRSLYGIDISPHAIEAACFVLLHDSLRFSTGATPSPWSIWQAFRLNLMVADATALSSPSGEDKLEMTRNRTAMRQTLFAGNFLPPAEEAPSSLTIERVSSDSGRSWSLDDIFPEIRDGFDVLVCNPPYAKVENRENGGRAGNEVSGHRQSSPMIGRNLYPIFIEMSWRFTVPERSTAALVVPLSIAYHRGRQFVNCRKAMSSRGGVWKFAFFDREPHALFGEDVKTRNAIIFRRELVDDPSRDTEAIVYSGPLRKWTSRTRKELFDEIDFTRLPNGDIEGGIPKVGGSSQSAALRQLNSLSKKLVRTWTCSDSCLPEETFSDAALPHVYVAGTAYNFLNVFRPQRIPCMVGRKMSQSKVARFVFSDEQYASAVFAIMSSQIVFWLWHVHSDGFHVSRKFLESIPFDDTIFSSSQFNKLARLGRTLWDELQDHTVVSVNGGRTTIAYRPHACHGTRMAIDRILVAAAGIDESFVENLAQFSRGVVVVDGSDERRALL